MTLKFSLFTFDWQVEFLLKDIEFLTSIIFVYFVCTQSTLSYHRGIMCIAECGAEIARYYAEEIDKCSLEPIPPKDAIIVPKEAFGGELGTCLGRAKLTFKTLES